MDRRELLRQYGTALAAASALGLSGCSGGDGGGDGGDDGGGAATTHVTTRAPLTPTDCTPREVTENVQADTTWSPEECPRVALDGNIKVQNGATLTIEPGVEVVGKPGAKLTIEGDGTLKANGEDENPIWFYGDSMASGHWETIEVESENPNELSNVVVRDAGGGDWAGVWIRGDARCSVTDSWFANNETWGLVAEDGAVLDFARNVFTGNGTAPVSTATTVVGALDSVSRYAGDNGNDHIEVGGTDVESEGTWPATDAPFYFEDNSRLFAPITVDPGAHFIFAEGAKLTVKEEGGLTANGESDQEIVFEGNAESPGYWETIEVESNNPDNVLDNVVVRDAGGGDWAGVWIRGDARCSVTNSTFENSATWGLLAEGGATLPEFSNNEFAGNETAPLSTATTVVASLDAESTYAGDNGNDRIEVNGTDVESEGTWPATDAPYYFEDNSRLFASITVDPGAHFQFAEGAKLTVKEGGSLSADAGDGDTIVFQGATDSPGYWETIEIESNNPDNVLDNVEVANGGSGDWANVWVRGGARAAISNSTFRDSATWGIVVEDGANVELSNNTYQDNAESGIDDRRNS
ncbi:MAG: right-handed parallel beta-helix repeat-containing protein [Haloarculaceae archaeon]